MDISKLLLKEGVCKTEIIIIIIYCLSSFYYYFYNNLGAVDAYSPSTWISTRRTLGVQQQQGVIAVAGRTIFGHNLERFVTYIRSPQEKEFNILKRRCRILTSGSEWADDLTGMNIL